MTPSPSRLNSTRRREIFWTVSYVNRRDPLSRGFNLSEKIFRKISISNIFFISIYKTDQYTPKNRISSIMNTCEECGIIICSNDRYHKFKIFQKRSIRTCSECANILKGILNLDIPWARFYVCSRQNGTTIHTDADELRNIPGVRYGFYKSKTWSNDKQLLWLGITNNGYYPSEKCTLTVPHKTTTIRDLSPENFKTNSIVGWYNHNNTINIKDCNPANAYSSLCEYARENNLTDTAVIIAHNRDKIHIFINPNSYVYWFDSFDKMDAARWDGKYVIRPEDAVWRLGHKWLEKHSK